MSFKNIRYELDEGIATLTISRPDVLNALNPQTVGEIGDGVSLAREDTSLRALIVTGDGEKSFVSGADIEELSRQDVVSGKEFPRFGQSVFNSIERLPKPVVAAVNGYALGGGCELAMACHVRVASENAKFGQPEVGLGIIPGYGGTQRLPRLVGKGVALELLMTGDIIDAQEALRVGLVNRVVPQDELMRTARAIALKMASRAPLAVGYVIEAVNSGLEVHQDEGMRLEADLFAITCATEDMKEGTKAFLEKRKPQFRGK